MFRDAGWPIYLVLLMALSASALGLVAVSLSAARSNAAWLLSAMVLLASAAVVLLALGGMHLDLRAVSNAVAMVNPSDREIILREGYKESRYCLTLGLVFAALPTVLGVISSALASLGPDQSKREGAFAAMGLLALSWVAGGYSWSQPIPGRELTPAQRDVLHLNDEFNAGRGYSACQKLAEFSEQVDRNDFPEFRTLQEQCSQQAISGQLRPGRTMDNGDAALLDQRVDLLGVLAQSKVFDQDLHAKLNDAWVQQRPPTATAPAGNATSTGAMGRVFGGLGVSDTDVAAAFAQAEGVKVATHTDAEAGPLTQEAITRVFRTRSSTFRYCYERELQKYPDLKGKVEISLGIGSDGKVQQASIRSSSLNDQAVHDCLIHQAKTMVFPKSSGTTNVSFPLVFTRPD
jgi:hypothetical protein